MRVNKLSDLTHEEFMRLNTLKVPDLPSGYTPYAATDKWVAPFVDWRQKVVESIQDIQKLELSVIF